MARGWESKSVEQQQEERQQQNKNSRPPISLEEQRNNRKCEGLQLSRKRVEQELESTTNEKRRRLLELALAELDAQLSADT
jgi:hypothetical protein